MCHLNCKESLDQYVTIIYLPISSTEDKKFLEKTGYLPLTFKICLASSKVIPALALAAAWAAPTRPPPALLAASWLAAYSCFNALVNALPTIWDPIIIICTIYLAMVSNVQRTAAEVRECYQRTVVSLEFKTEQGRGSRDTICCPSKMTSVRSGSLHWKHAPFCGIEQLLIPRMR